MGVQKKKKCPVGAPGWMVSWSDMTTLLLTFFIILMSFAEIDGKDFYLVLSSFRGSLGMFQGGYSLSAGRLEELGQNMMNLPSVKMGRALSKSLKNAVSIFKPEIRSKKVRVTEDIRGLVITLSGDAFFAPGSAVLKDGTRDILKKIGNVVNRVPNFVRIEGHTDSRIIDSKNYPTNWELSSARSINVLRYMTEEEKVNSKKLSTGAFGEQRPLDDNNTPEGRAYNRRVDIVILRDKIYEKSKSKKIERPLPDEEWRLE
ncbi:MAG: flagellar motor protein MotB [bacterium]|nr:flagellar motor protein MotB [bacterium]